MKKKKGQEIRSRLKKIWNSYKEAASETAVETLETELGEMENIFGLLVLGSFVGFPAPPLQITLDLLPDMEKHFLLMLNKTDTAQSPLSELLSVFDVM
ncbi:hypothetical protein LA303_11370 [Candidatus Sulfidibacterium hydrothermale]|uniref:hypothetical protein n=1 Tax=Candidatus Sulfidibacterium hydrothermale TaxID=2875962 RepID=UPI001F0A082A|nr:hypothetical protein [Candidatus Sulfidibacterium hydrothermale]UBM61996.1 hypothetical protein LA303_11370 [Candidatus Sulfidibacterium hydrothermale]